jgi:hypothetical protein
MDDQSLLEARGDMKAEASTASFLGLRVILNPKIQARTARLFV